MDKKQLKWHSFEDGVMKVAKNGGKITSQETYNKIWNAFGSFVARIIKQGKGVLVPSLGTFTFSPISVDQ